MWSALGFVPAAQAAPDDVGRAAPPSWVEELPVPTPRADRLRQVEDGVYYLLLDDQVRPEGDRETFYTRNVYKVTDRRGLEEAARFEIDFDPGREHVVLHHIRVLRGGAVLDRTGSADIQVLRREQGLDKGIFDGRKTIHVEIKDVQVGDIVDYAYSWETDVSFWPGEFFGRVKAVWSVPLELMHYRLFWPANRPLTIRNRGVDVEPTRTRSGDDTVYDWRLVDAPPVHGEDGTPDWYPSWGEVELSSMANWGQVVNWALPLYTGKDALPPELAARVAAIQHDFKKPEDRVTEAMRLVEDDLRYVSLSIGAGSYTPRSPSEVFHSGFGDCKDKSQLLVALLRAMGIEAYVALTDMDDGPGLPGLAPSANVFDHAIVQVRLHGKSYWLDPTGSNEGGRFPHLAGLNYGYALPLAPGQARLERIVRPEAPHITFRTVERYMVGEGANPGLGLNVVTTYDADEADSIRSSIASKSQAQLEADYLKFYAEMYPGLTRAAPIRITDNRDANRIVITEAYRLGPADLRRGKLMEKFEVKASSMGTYEKIPSGHRLTPYGLTYPVNQEHVITLVTPGRRPPAPPDVAIDNAAFRYSLDSTRAGDTLTLDYKLNGLTDLLPAGDVEAAAADAQTVSDDDYWYLDLTSTRGGTMGNSSGGGDWTEAIKGLLALVGAIAIGASLVYALNRGLHGDDGHAADGFYYPVAPVKFLLLGFATLGVYPLFWMWKCWRWIQIHEKAQMLPYWRGLFGAVWLYPLLRDVGRREPLPLILRIAGIGAAGLIVVWLLADFVAAVMGTNLALVTLAFAASTVFFLPALIAVNRVNGARPGIERANSHMAPLTSVALLLGLSCWIAIAYLAFAPAMGAG
jgi:hypothetical protein